MEVQCSWPPGEVTWSHVAESVSPVARAAGQLGKGARGPGMVCVSLHSGGTAKRAILQSSFTLRLAAEEMIF